MSAALPCNLRGGTGQSDGAKILFNYELWFMNYDFFLPDRRAKELFVGQVFHQNLSADRIWSVLDIFSRPPGWRFLYRIISNHVNPLYPFLHHSSKNPSDLTKCQTVYRVLKNRVFLSEKSLEQIYANPDHLKESITLIQWQIQFDELAKRRNSTSK